MNYTLSVSSEDDPAVREAITAPLRAYNIAKAGPGGYQPLVVVVRDELGQARGGASGFTAYGWLYVQLMVVPEDARGQGLGRKVMALAEATAAQRGCHDAWLDTHEFQARGFYEKLGYEQFGELQDYPAPFRRYFFRKRLAAAGPGAD